MQPDAMTGASEQRWVIDSTEEGIASVEVDGATMITVPLALLPHGVRQGDVLRVHVAPTASGERSGISFEIDADATAQARARSAAQVQKGTRQANDPGGDLKF